MNLSRMMNLTDKSFSIIYDYRPHPFCYSEQISNSKKFIKEKQANC